MLELRSNIDKNFYDQKKDVQTALKTFYKAQHIKYAANLHVSNNIRLSSDIYYEDKCYVNYIINAHDDFLYIDVIIYSFSQFYLNFSSLQEFISFFLIDGISTRLNLAFKDSEDSTVDTQTRLSEDVLVILQSGFYSQVTFDYIDAYLDSLDLGNIDLCNLEKLEFINDDYENEKKFFVKVGPRFKHNLDSIFIALERWEDLKIVLHKSNITFSVITCFSTAGFEIIEIPHISIFRLATYSSLTEVLKKLTLPELLSIDYIKI